MKRRLWPAAVAGLALAGGAALLREAPLEPVAYASDGDTLVMRSGEIVRVLGVDTPELHPCRCVQECNQGAAARAFTGIAVSAGVVLSRRGRDRYGRSLAAVRVVDSGRRESLADLLVRAGLGRPYRGGARSPWCPPGTAAPVQTG